MERDGRVVSSKVRLVSAEPCHPVQRRDENACARTISIPAIRHFAIHCLPFAACIHTTPLPPLTTTIPIRIRKFFELSKQIEILLLLLLAFIIIRIRLCKPSSRDSSRGNRIFLREKDRDRQIDRNTSEVTEETVEHRARVDSGYILCVFRDIYQSSERIVTKTLSYGIDSYIPALFRALRCRIDSRRHRDGGTEKNGDGGEGSGAERGEAAVSR